MMATPKGRPWIALAFVIPFVVLLVIHAFHYLPFISDDALISLRYANRLLEGKGLTWTDGHPVEGYSNLLWLLAVAFLGLLGSDLVKATRLLGVLGMSVILCSIAWWYLRQGALRVAWFPLTVALLFVCLGAPIAVWAIGGLEQPLCGALLAISIPLAFLVLESDRPERGRVLALSLSLGLLCLTRPDGPVFAAGAATALLIVGQRAEWGWRISRSLLVLFFPVLFYGGQLIFRVFYYGELVPNTALVKFAPSLARLDGGLQYLTGAFRALAPFSFLAVVSLLALLIPSRTRGRAVYLLTTAILWSAYVVSIGGDIFPAYRHVVPLMVVFAFALAEGCSAAVSQLVSRPRFLYPFLAAGLLLFVPYTQGQFADKQSQRAIRERWEWQGKELGLLLKTAFWKQQPLLAVTAAGCLPYWSELPALDMMGLNDYYLPRHPPPDIGQGFIGHELGDGKYVLDQRPDIIVFSVGTEPAFRSGDEMARIEEFHDRYVPVMIATSVAQPAAIVYFNKESEKIGILRSGSVIRVPGFLLTGKDTIANVDSGGKLVARIPAGQAARVTFRSDLHTSWAVDVKASVRDGIASEVSQDGALVCVTVRPKGAEPASVEELMLRSVPRSASGGARGTR